MTDDKEWLLNVRSYCRTNSFCVEVEFSITNDPAAQKSLLNPDVKDIEASHCRNCKWGLLRALGSPEERAKCWAANKLNFVKKREWGE